mmetsp:Transcript_31714/g.58700  ORF Transcript_31714/g.58700 Transcript_31714/m.58700 type:complete len:247 (-) Transcript_31714:311-1051(-)
MVNLQSSRPSLFLCNSVRLANSPSSTTSSKDTNPRANASSYSPRSFVCTRLSATSKSAAAIKSGSSSILPVESEPIALICNGPRDAFSDALVVLFSFNNGALELVAVTIKSHWSSNSCASSTARTFHPSSSMSTMNCRTFSFDLPHTITLLPRRHPVMTCPKYRSWNRAWTPVPKIPMRQASPPLSRFDDGANIRTATAPAAAVRSSVNKPSSNSMVSNLPVRWEYSCMQPELAGKGCPPVATLMT